MSIYVYISICGGFFNIYFSKLFLVFELCLFKVTSTWYTPETHNGVKRCGYLLSEEILDLVNEEFFDRPKFTIIAHSLGGLISRYALGLIDEEMGLDQVFQLHVYSFSSD